MSQVRDPSHAFARMDLGPTLELPVEVPSSVPLDPWRTPRFAWLEDGRDMLVGGDPVHTFPLTFSDPRHPRQLRRFLQEASLTIARLSLAEHAEEAGVHAGKLSLTRTARFVELSGPLVITINDEACRSWTGRTSPDPDLAKRLCFDLPGRSTGFSVIRTPVLLHAEQEVSQISVLSADGWELQGLLEEQGSRARIAIHAASQLEGVGPGNQVRYGGALLALGGGLQLAAAGSEGPWMDLADHSVLRPSNNRILSAWLRYHELERQRAEQLLEARNKPLRYDTARQQQDGWELAIACLPEVLQPWLPADDKGRRTIKVDQAVEVLGAGSDEVICTGSVTRLRQVDPSQGTAKALLSLDSTKGERSPPPNNGRLRAVADRGQGRQASRRREAAERLVRGDTINPRVLTWLTEPTSLGTPQRKHRAPMLRPAPDATQQEAVAKALGLEDLLLRARRAPARPRSSSRSCCSSPVFGEDGTSPCASW